MAITETQHKGKSILFCDYADLSSERCLKELEDLDRRIGRTTGPLRVISNFENASIGPEFMSRVKALGKSYHDRLEREAVIGLSKMNMLLLSAYTKFTGANVRAFSSKAEALDFAAS